MLSKYIHKSAFLATLLGLSVLSLSANAEVAYDAYEELSGTHRPIEMLMPNHMPRDKNAMVSKKDFMHAAGKMWDEAATEMQAKNMKMMTMEQYKNFFENYLKR